MAEMFRIKGAQEFIQKLKIKGKKFQSVSVIVGYSANYALGVHENIEMKGKGKPRRKPSKGLYWDPQGTAQAKFLEQPAREKRKEIVKMIREIVTATGNLEQGLLFTGLYLQRESQLLVPVDTGALKASAFTKKETYLPGLTMHN